MFVTTSRNKKMIEKRGYVILSPQSFVAIVSTIVGILKVKNIPFIELVYDRDTHYYLSIDDVGSLMQILNGL